MKYCMSTKTFKPFSTPDWILGSAYYFQLTTLYVRAEQYQVSE